MTEHHDQPFRLQGAGGVDDMLRQGLAGDRVQDLGQIGVHALALAGSEDDDIHGVICGFS